MICFSRLKMIILSLILVGAITYSEKRLKDEKHRAGMLPMGVKASYEESNISKIKRMKSLSYVENPYKETTGYPD